jgi:phage gp16-like protein
MKIPREKLKKYFDKLNESYCLKERNLEMTEEEKNVVFCNNLSNQEIDDLKSQIAELRRFCWNYKHVIGRLCDQREKMEKYVNGVRIQQRTVVAVFVVELTVCMVYLGSFLVNTL